MIKPSDNLMLQLNAESKPKIIFFDIGSAETSCTITLELPSICYHFGGPINSGFWKSECLKVIVAKLKQFECDYQFTTALIYPQPILGKPQVTYVIKYHVKSEQQKERERIEYFISTLPEL